MEEARSNINSMLNVYLKNNSASKKVFGKILRGRLIHHDTELIVMREQFDNGIFLVPVNDIEFANISSAS